MTTPIIGYEGLYTIDENGNVFSIKTKKIIRPRLMKNYIRKGTEYLTINLSKNGIRKMYLFHRLIALHFIPNPDNKPEINHKDGNRLNNKIENLEWVTSSENSIHAIRILHTKTRPLIQPTLEQRPRGEQVGNSIFKDSDIINMRKDHKNGMGCRKLAKKYNTSMSNAYRIVYYQTWKHIVEVE